MIYLNLFLVLFNLIALIGMYKYGQSLYIYYREQMKDRDDRDERIQAHRWAPYRTPTDVHNKIEDLSYRIYKIEGKYDSLINRLTLPELKREGAIECACAICSS